MTIKTLNITNQVLKLMLFITFGIFVAATNAAELKLTVITEILPIDPVSGMKSTQNIAIDTSNWTTTSSYTTGATYGVPSVNDVFSADVSIQPDTSHVVTIKGATETGLGLGLAPAINYTVILDFDSNGSYQMYGTHDGYPAYTVEVNGVSVYRFEHKSLDLAELTEPEEIDIPVKEFSL